MRVERWSRVFLEIRVGSSSLFVFVLEDCNRGVGLQETAFVSKEKGRPVETKRRIVLCGQI